MGRMGSNHISMSHELGISGFLNGRTGVWPCSLATFLEYLCIAHLAEGSKISFQRGDTKGLRALWR